MASRIRPTLGRTFFSSNSRSRSFRASPAHLALIPAVGGKHRYTTALSSTRSRKRSNAMADLHVDALVIGSGQGGGPLAGAFARAGRRTVLIERRYIGGTCINDGCTPTKTMIASARVAYLAKRASDFGVRGGDVSVDLSSV